MEGLGSLNLFWIEYLPYHYLLTTLGKEGTLRYQDISTGTVVACKFYEGGNFLFIQNL